MEKRTETMEPSVQRIRAPWHLWFTGLFFAFIYSNGIYDYFMILGQNEAYYSAKNYGEAILEYFTDYPILPLIFWTLNVFSGLIAPILLLTRSRMAVKVSLISFVSILCLEVITFAFMNRWNTLGPWISLFDIGVLVTTFGLFFYCRLMNKRGVLR